MKYTWNLHQVVHIEVHQDAKVLNDLTTREYLGWWKELDSQGIL